MTVRQRSRSAFWLCRGCHRRRYNGHQPCTRCCGYTTDPSRWLKERDTR